MKRRIGILTSGGDCPGLNAVIRGVAKAAYERMEEVEIIGIMDGFSGLIEGEFREMKQREFSGILTLGGTILGSSRQPFSQMREVKEGSIDKVKAMKENYKKMKLDCLLVLGGNGTHKTANLLFDEGLNIIGLPKTIDNDIWGTDITFGFHSAVDIATDVIDRIHTTAASHGRVMLIEIMGNKAGWLTLYSGLAGGADIILLPEIPYSPEKIMDALNRRSKAGRIFSILAIAEGALDKQESKLSKKDRQKKREEMGERTVTDRLAKLIGKETGLDTRTVVPGHIQRGGSPSAYDRLLSTQFGVYAAGLIENEIYGVTVGMVNNAVTHNPLSVIAGRTKFVPENCQMITVAKRMGISFGD